MKLSFQGKYFEITLEQANNYRIELGEDALGNITRINNAIDNIPRLLEKQKKSYNKYIPEVEKQNRNRKNLLQEEELKQKVKKISRIKCRNWIWNSQEILHHKVNKMQKKTESKTEEKQEIRKNF